jgi:hypothetical protein
MRNFSQPRSQFRTSTLSQGPGSLRTVRTRSAVTIDDQEESLTMVSKSQDSGWGSCQPSNIRPQLTFRFTQKHQNEGLRTTGISWTPHTQCYDSLAFTSDSVVPHASDHEVTMSWTGVSAAIYASSFFTTVYLLSTWCSSDVHQKGIGFELNTMLQQLALSAL